MKLIVTNNPDVRDFFEQNRPSDHTLQWINGHTGQVLLTVRDLCHAGFHLATHPLSGSVKPNQTPYKTVVLTDTHPAIEYMESVSIAEKCFLMAQSLLASRFYPFLPDETLKDFALIDLDLFKSYLIAYV
jgi:hypothetical protein